MASWTEYSLGQLLSYEQPTAYIVESADYNDSYRTPVVTAGKTFILGYTNEDKGVYSSLPVIIFDDFTTASKFVNFKFKVKSSAMKILTTNSELVLPKFIFYRMQIIKFDASTHKRYWIQHYSKIKVRIPPILEQERIVARIEELFSQLDAGVAELKTAKERLKVYRQAVLKEAFSKFDGSIEKTISSVCENIVDCPHSTPKYDGIALAYPSIRTSEIKNGRIDWGSMKYVDYSEYLERTKRLVPIAGDIVYAREGTYGDCVILPAGSNFCLGQRTMLFRPDSNKCTSIYLHQVLRSDPVKQQADKSNAGSTVPHVNIADAKNFKFPLPPLKLQNQYGNFVEQIDKSRLTIQQSLAKLEVLKKALMQEYFG